MITLSQVAEMVGAGLTSLLDDPNIDFHIWANAGEWQKNTRNGNTVTAYIQGTLRSSSSSNEANILAMGYNGLQLDIEIPLKAPKTLSTQTAQQLATVAEAQYPFVTLILAAIDNYFSVANVFTMSDATGTEFTVSMVAGRAITGDPNIAAALGRGLVATVFIGLNFLQGGISARNIVLNVDGVRVPLNSVTIGRALQKTSDVYSDQAGVKNLASASAISIDFAFPANADNTTAQVLNAIFGGKTNVAHFVEVNIGSAYDGQYLMIFDNLALAGENVLFAGLTGSLIEAAARLEILDFPAYMQVGYFTFSSSQVESLTFTASGLAYIAGNIVTLSGENTITLPASAFTYSAENGVYFVFMATLGQVAVTNASAPFTVVQEAVGVPNG